MVMKGKSRGLRIVSDLWVKVRGRNPFRLDSLDLFYRVELNGLSSFSIVNQLFGSKLRFN